MVLKSQSWMAVLGSYSEDSRKWEVEELAVDREYIELTENLVFEDLKEC